MNVLLLETAILLGILWVVPNAVILCAMALRRKTTLNQGRVILVSSSLAALAGLYFSWNGYFGW